MKRNCATMANQINIYARRHSKINPPAQIPRPPTRASSVLATSTRASLIRVSRVTLTILAAVICFAAVLPAQPETATFVFASGSTADVLDSKKEELGKVDSELSDVRKDIESAAYENYSLDSQAEEIDVILRAKEMSYQELADTLAYYKEEVAAADSSMAEAEKTVEGQRELIKARVRAIYMRQDGSAIEALLSSSGMTDFLEKVKIFGSISRHDKELFLDYQTAKEDVEYKRNAKMSVADSTRNLATGELYEIAQTSVSRAAIEAQLNALQSRIENLDELERGLLEQSKELETEIRALTAKAEAEAARKAAAEKAAAEAAARKKSQSSGASSGQKSSDKSSASSGAGYTGGALGWPVSGHTTLSSQYGVRVHPITKVKKSHTGIDIPAPSGTPISAAKGGTVIISGNKGGYGLTVAIDHGGGIVTLYGHCSKLLVKTGQTVKQGATIAKVGSTGVSTGPHCHFEVRVNGGAVQPLNYFNRG